MSSINDWIAAATKIKEQTKKDYINSNQGLINSINQQKDSAIQGLQNANTQAINALNQNKNTVNETALESAKQANINRLLALKDNKNAMNRAGLGSQGVVGSQVNSINNSYGSNLNSILKDKASGLRDIENQINNTNLEYETNKSNLAAQYAATLAQQQADINTTAEQLAQSYYNNYISQQQAAAEFEWQKKQAEKENQLAWANLNASYNFKDSDNYEVNTAYYQGSLNPDAYNGTFKNGYQPNNINGKKLTDSGKDMKLTTTDRYGNTKTLTQTVWKTPDGKKWYWDGRYNKYFEYKG